MSLNLSIPEILITCIIVLYAFGIIVYLQRRSNDHPYKVISSRWVIFLLSTIIFSQIYTTLTMDEKDIEYYQLISKIFISNIKLICLIMRCYTLKQMISYSTAHLNIKFNEENYSFRKRFFQRQFKYYKTFIAILVVLFLMTFYFIGTETLLLGMKTYLCFLYDINGPQEENGLYLTVWFLCNLGLTYVTFGFYLYYGLSLFTFKLSRDYFKIRAEIVTSFLIEFVSFNVPHLILFSIIENRIPRYCLFVFESLFNVGILILHGVLIYMRHCAFQNFTNDYVITQLDKLLSCPYSFQLFGDYIKTNEASSYQYLSFWIDYVLFTTDVNKYKAELRTMKPLASSNIEESFNSQLKSGINEQKMELRKAALKLFKEHFKRDNDEDNFMQTTASIELPEDIYSNLDTALKDNFIENFDSIFLEAFDCVSQKIIKLFSNYMDIQEEKEKRERVMFDKFCFEIFPKSSS